MNTSDKQKTVDEWVDEYMEYRRFSKLGTACYYGIRGFANYIRKRYPDLIITQDRLNDWCVKRTDCCNSSYNTRLAAIRNFIDFVNDRSGSNLVCASPLKNDRIDKDPVLFNDKELANFFKACDELTVNRKFGLIHDYQILAIYEIPVIFRLLYSTGIRVTEARKLMVDDVDLNRGILSIKQSKGYRERMVALHPSMICLLVKYEKIMAQLMPNRKVFFPDVNDNVRNDKWICYHFRRLWDKYNDSKGVVAYSFRHNYAVHNVNNMPRDGYVISENLIALSKSMGHATMDSTLYYYHLVPKFANIYASTMNETLDEIIPEYE